MKLFFTILVTIAIAVGLAMVSMEDPGYVVFSREPYVVRLPLLMLVLIVFVLFVALYLLFNFIAGIFRAPRRFETWQNQSRENSAHKHTMLGYAGLIEGNWARAEQALLKQLDHNKTPLMNYLGAAYAAQQQGNYAARNKYLDDALARHPDHHLSINLTRARLLYQAGEIVETRNYLEALRKSDPRSIPVARLLWDSYKDLGDWTSLVELMPVLTKLKAYSAEDLEVKEQFAYESLLSSPALLQNESSRPGQTWKSLPSSTKKQPQVISSYVKQLIFGEKMKEAESVLRTALNRKYDSDLIYLYGKVNSPFMEYQIQLAETFLKKHNDDVNLLLTLARLYRYDKNYEKSREFYDQAITLDNREEIFIDLGSLLEQLGEQEAAMFNYKKGISALMENTNEPVQGDSESNEVVLLDSDDSAATKQTMPVVR